MSNSKELELEFLAMIEHHERIVWKVVYFYAKDKEETNDMIQEVMLNLWKSFSTFRNESSLSTWIYRIALNTCISFFRKNKKHQSLLLLDTEAFNNDYQLGESEDLQILINQLGALDKSLVLLYLEGCSYEEIAKIVDISVSNVGTKLSRIKQKLKEISDK